MSEPREGSVPTDKTQEVLTRVSASLDRVILDSPINVSGKPTFIDPYNPDIRSSSAGYAEDELRFWGSLESRFPYTGLNTQTAIIKDFKIPDGLKDQGLGSKLLEAWEKAMIADGVTNFAATNINKAALNFWIKNGYRIPPEQADRETPYAVVKIRIS